jgi:hypothetical protein
MIHVVFLAPEVFPVHAEFVRGLKEVGARVSGVGHTPRERVDPRLLRWLDRYEAVRSVFDVDAVVGAARRAAAEAPLDRFEAVDESLVLPAAAARERLGLPGLSLRSAELCRDKPKMKEALRAAGLPCAASTAADSLASLAHFAEQVGFPLIVKPRASLGSLGTYRVDSFAELERAGRELGVDRGHSVAVEEFIEGHEGFYDTISIDGEVVHEFVSHYYPNVLPAMRDRRISPQIVATNRVELKSYQELKELGRRVIKVLGIPTSATHMEWFFGPKGLKFSEIGARPPGERLWDLYCAGNEVDLYREWAHCLVWRRPSTLMSRRFAAGSIQIRPDRDGTIVGYEGLDDMLRRFKDLVFASEIARPGTPTVPIEKGYLCNCWFRLRHPDYDTLRGILDHIGRTVRLFARP